MQNTFSSMHYKSDVIFTGRVDDKVLTMLPSKQLLPNSMTAVGVGSMQPVHAETSETDKQLNRSVSFKVSLLDPRQARMQERPR